MVTKKISVKGMEIGIFQKKEEDYISLTDIARYKNPNEPNDIIKNWVRSKNTLQFLGLWEKLNNPDFKEVEFDLLIKDAGSHHFVLSPGKWCETTKAIGLSAKAGKKGGTFAHKDIAFEFASWISPEFKLYLIKEFQRLKEIENEKTTLGWDFKRYFAKINYRIHTDAIKENIIPHKIGSDHNTVYANEADVLNKALFGKTAKEWRDQNPNKEGNIRDYSSATQLVCLANLESLNAEFIRENIEQKERLIKLNKIAIIQMRSLMGVNFKKLD